MGSHSLPLMQSEGFVTAEEYSFEQGDTKQSVDLLILPSSCVLPLMQALGKINRGIVEFLLKISSVPFSFSELDLFFIVTKMTWPCV